MIASVPAHRFAPGLAVASALLALAVGCEQGKPGVSTSKEEATVKGRVTIGGQAVKKGEVSFDPANYQRKDVSARTVKIGDNGSYAITTLLGENRVTVVSPEMARGRVANQEFQYEVKSGENSFDINLDKPK